MNFFELFSILVGLSAIFAYINIRYIKLPTAIGLMLVSIIFSLSIIATSRVFPALTADVKGWVSQFDLSDILLKAMLSFLLFAGAIHIKIKDLRNEWPSIVLYSTLGVFISTIIIGYVCYFLLPHFGIRVQLIHAMMFGSLISPTDPIAVLAILRKAGISKSLETKIAGESLFNDGVAVVIFLTLWQIAQSPTDFTGSDVALLFAQEAGGGVLLGLLLGYIGYRMLYSIDAYDVEVLITLGIVMTGYTIANLIHVSGPLAMVVAGIIVGNQGRSLGMSRTTEEYIDKFWEILDETLNAVLFVLMGLELIVIPFNSVLFWVGFILIGAVLIVRYISLWLPSSIFLFREKVSQRTLLILTWGGLRGGISIALALSLLPEFGRDIWVPITYVIVCFSILVQGTTIGLIKEKPSASD